LLLRQTTTQAHPNKTIIDDLRLTIQLQLHFIEQLCIEGRFWGFNKLLDVSLELFQTVHWYFLHLPRIPLLLQASHVQGVYAFPRLGAAHAKQYRTEIESFERQTDRDMANDSYSFWRFGHSQATYVGQLERTAAREGSASTYERVWHDSFVNGRRNYALVNGDGSHGLGRLFALGFNGGRDMEFRPELPAPRSRPPRANPFYAVSAEDVFVA
jgi:hypothetical protein